MSALLLITNVLSTQIPKQAVEQTWGTLMRAPKFAGAWSVTAGDRTYRGDWLVVDQDVTSTRLGMRRWAHLISSTSTQECAIAIDEPGRMRCESATGVVEDLRIPVLDFTRPFAIASDVEIERCAEGGCRRVAVGRIEAQLAARTVGGEQAAKLYASLHRRTLEAALGATRLASRSLIMTMPFRTAGTRGTSTELASGYTQYASDVIAGEATIYFGYDAEPTITIREVERYVEDCKTYAGSCSMPMPNCVRRTAAPAVSPGDAKSRPTPATARR
jgi:hypothetical protein